MSASRPIPRGEGARPREGKGRRRHWALLVAAVVALLSVGGVGIARTLGSGSARPASTLERGSVRLPGEVVPGLRSWLARGVLRRVPTAPAAEGRPINLTLVLKRGDQAGFERFVAAVEDRHSPLYRHFMTQRQLADRFGPSRQAYAAALAWAHAQHFTLLRGSSNRLTISVRGNRAQVERTFDVRIGDYATKTGKRFYANTQNPAIPPSLAGRIAAIGGLTNLGAPARAPRDIALKLAYCAMAYVILRIPVVTYNGEPQSEIDAESAALAAELKKQCGDTPFGGPGAKVKRAVPLEARAGRAAKPRASHPRASAADGTGQKIGLLEFASLNASDVGDFLNLIGDGATEISHLSSVNVDGGAGAPGGPGESEALLDADIALSTAPGATVVVYAGPATASYEDMFNAMISDGDTVISNSWSSCEDQVSAAEAHSIDQVLATAAASGISVLNGAGDSGSTCLDGSANTIGVPADSPNATAVGGTSPTTGPAGIYGSETWWNGTASTPQTGAGGFGVSSFFTRPSYQQGINAGSMRSIPDISLAADPAVDPFTICQADAGGCPNGLSYGGTSAATPLMAGFVALLNQQQGHNLGALNPALYPLSGTGAFHSPASMGSDFAHVGLGSPNVNQLGLELRGAGPGAPTAITSSVAADKGGETPADGATRDPIVVQVADAAGNPISGQHVTLTANGGNSQISPSASGITSANNGTAVFDVTDSTQEQVTYTATATDAGNLVLGSTTVDFVAPVATGASIQANQLQVPNNGTTPVTITVYLQNGLGRPAAGKTVAVSAHGSSAQLSSPTAVTGSDGTATFTATDSTQESVQFTATDVTDGNLPVPGSATVSFQPAGPPCADTAPTPVSGYSVSTFASGLPINQQALVTNNGGLTFTLGACFGTESLAFDSSGNILVPDPVDGRIYQFGPGGGTAGSATALPGTSFAAGGQLGGIAFGKNGELFAGLNNTGGNFHDPQLVRINPSTGATQRVIATQANGLAPCPFGIAVDPLSGDVFTVDICSGSLASGNITRVANPDSASPTVSAYATVSSACGLTFSPDGELYVADCGNNSIESVSATNGPSPPTVTHVATLSNTPSGVAVAAVGASGNATALDVTDFSGNVTRVDLTSNPATTTPIAASGSPLYTGAIGPDGCLYASDRDLLLKLTGGGCSNAKAGPQIRLSSSGPSPAPTGSSVTFTAQLSNFASVPGAPVTFLVSGANSQVKLVRADSSGKATFALSGVLTGGDIVTASAANGSTTFSSAALGQHWTAGKDTTFLDLNASPQGGSAGQPATISASLVDVSHTPPAVIAGQSVTLGLGTSSCTANTNASGLASCQLTPPSVGLLTLSASYSGSSTYTAASATSAFVAVLPALRSTSTSVSCVPGTVTVGAASACTATVSDTAPGSATTPTGAVSFSSNSSGTFSRPGGSCTLSGSGASASCLIGYTPSAVGSGRHTITAAYGADSRHASSIGAVGLTVTTTGLVRPQNVVAPRISGTPLPGDRLSCSTGTWTNSPTAYAYRWKRSGAAIRAATHATYTVQIADEARSLKCSVIASNAAGAGSPATSAGVLVAVSRATLRCPKPTGTLSGARLGKLSLGMSRKSARKKLPRFGVTHNAFDNFCLYAGWGIRAGYPSGKLLRSVPRAQRRRITGIILLLTANPFYALDRVRPGAKLTRPVSRRLHLGKVFKVGLNDWYIGPGKNASVLKVRGKVIQEVGVANGRLLKGRRAQLRFLRSFSSS